MTELDQKEERKKKASRKSRVTLITTFLLVFGIPLIIGTISYPIGLIGFNHVYSEGTRIGQVVKMSEKGLIWKTNEGSLGVTQSGAYVERWDFSIDSENDNRDNLVLKLSEASKAGNLVEIKYSQRIGVRPWRAKTSYLVEDVVILK